MRTIRDEDKRRDEIPHDWRDALTAIAHALRAVCLAHPWVVTAAGRQPLIGPNVIRHVEQSLQATAALGLDWTKRLAIWRAVDSYTMGHAHLSPGRDHSDGTTAEDPGWRAAAEAYLQGLAGSGSFPNLAAFGAAGLLHAKYDELTFETGLNWLLTGIGADAQAAGGWPAALRWARMGARGGAGEDRARRRDGRDGSRHGRPRRDADVPRRARAGDRGAQDRVRAGPAGQG